MADKMKEFFNVIDLDQVFEYIHEFAPVGIEETNVADSLGRIIAQDIVADTNLPDFRRATMDGFAVQGASTFGASDGNPAYLVVKGSVAMGAAADQVIIVNHHDMPARLRCGEGRHDARAFIQTHGGPVCLLVDTKIGQVGRRDIGFNHRDLIWQIRQ